jgi:hypothetical protein
MSVGINYRRNIYVGNSVAFLRFSGSVKKAIDSSMADVPVEELMRLFLLAVLPCDDED